MQFYYMTLLRQFSCVMIRTEYAAAFRMVPVAISEHFGCGSHLDTGVVAVVKQKAIH